MRKINRIITLSKKIVISSACAAALILSLNFIPTSPLPASTVQAAAGQIKKNYIGLQAAKKKALADAKLKASAVTFTKAKFEYDDGLAVYDIEFRTSAKKYEYEIKAYNGSILERDTKVLKKKSSKQTKKVKAANKKASSKKKAAKKTTSSKKTARKYIGVDKAKSIALKKAGLTASKVTFKKAKLDKDDGLAIYEIEFLCQGMEYEAEIHAVSGKILDYDAERDD